MILSDMMAQLVKNVDSISLLELEDFNNYIITQTSSDIKNLNSSSLQELLDSINSRDSIYTLDLSVNESEPISYENTEDFISELDLILSALEIINIKIVLQISKSKVNNVKSIYNIDAFEKYIKSLNISQILTNINSQSSGSYLYLEIQDLNSTLYYSDLMCFKSKNINFHKTFTNDTSIINRRKAVCSYLSSDSYDFTPKNFDFNGNINYELSSIMDRLKILFSLIYIFNISSIKDNNLYLKIEGYKSSEFQLDFININLSKLHCYYEMFQWVYSEGNLSDKIGIARNIISLYLINSSSIDIDNSTLKAVESNYNIYLKENVEKYLQIKATIVESMINMNKEISSIANSITQGFINNLLAIFSFYFTITVMNSLSDKRLDNIFTKDISIVAITIIFLSVIYLIFSCYQVKCEKKRLNTVYQRLKSSYKEILVPKDIETIFNNDADFTEDIESIDKKVSVYIKIWCLTLFIISLTTIFLSRNYLIDFLNIIYNTLKYLIFKFIFINNYSK